MPKFLFSDILCQPAVNNHGDNADLGFLRRTWRMQNLYLSFKSQTVKIMTLIVTYD